MASPITDDQYRQHLTNALKMLRDHQNPAEKQVAPNYEIHPSLRNREVVLKEVNDLSTCGHKSQSNPLYNVALTIRHTHPEEAFLMFERFAARGDEHAMLALSAMLFQGEVTKKADPEAALKWALAAAKTCVVAHHNISGMYYQKGELKLSFYWIKSAAEKGFKPAYFELACRYRDGEGTPKDLDKAIEWLKKSVQDAKEIAAHSKLGHCYGERFDTTKLENERKMAVEHYKQALLKGDNEQIAEAATGLLRYGKSEEGLEELLASFLIREENGKKIPATKQMIRFRLETGVDSFVTFGNGKKKPSYE